MLLLLLFELKYDYYVEVLIVLLILFSIKGGPYAAFGGRDASRGLATFSVTANPDLEYDDLSDLNSMEMDSVREWEMQFKGKICV